MTTALLTDHYELTMLTAAMKSKTAFRHSLFDLFTRRLPEGRRYGVVAGVGRVLEAIKNFKFDTASLEFLSSHKIIDSPTAEWLANFKFQGNIWGYAEGEIYFPGSPVLSVEGTFAECVILETLLLSIYNHDSAIAAAASRMTSMSGGRPCFDMGARRTHEYAAVAAARAAYIAGFAGSSDLEAGRKYGIPTMGTAAHSFTLLHDCEKDAFSAQIESMGQGTTLLVDTYDIENAIRVGVELTKGNLGAIRIDSGDLAYAAQTARELLDDLGASHTKIVVTSDLDEWQLAALRGVPIDSYGIGTSLVTGSGHPTCGFIYKLVARSNLDSPNSAMIPVAKRSKNKSTLGGRKFAYRKIDERGFAEAELIGIGRPPQNDKNIRNLLVDFIRNGEVVFESSLAQSRAKYESSIKELPPAALRISKGEPALDTIILDPDGQQTSNPYLNSPNPRNI